MKVYISGPMSGLPESNFPAFHAAAQELKALGVQPVNPAELTPTGADTPPPDAADAEHKAYWRKCLRVDIKALMDCDALVLLDGWEGSSGAHLEVHVAHRVGIAVYPWLNFCAMYLPRGGEAPAAPISVDRSVAVTWAESQK